MARRYYRRRRRKQNSEPLVIVLLLVLGITFGISYLGMGGGIFDEINMLMLTVLAVMALLVAGIMLFGWWVNKQRMSGVDMVAVDAMSGDEFEEYVAYLCKKSGYKSVSTTNYAGDYGADVVASKNGVKYVIQAKRYKNNVGIKAVGEITMGKGYYNADKAMIVTNSNLTKQATESAKRNQVEVVDRDGLIDWIRSTKK